jgi:hypothetical protein
VARMTQTILELFPICPPEEARAIARIPRREEAVEWDALLRAERLNRGPSRPPLSRRFVAITHVTISYSCVKGIEMMPAIRFAMPLSA